MFYLESEHITKQYAINPTDERKSFYGKARVKEYDTGEKVLTSYDTDVLTITSNGELKRNWMYWSATTARHVNSFLELNGFKRVNKNEWFEIPWDCNLKLVRGWI